MNRRDLLLGATLSLVSFQRAASSPPLNLNPKRVDGGTPIPPDWPTFTETKASEDARHRPAQSAEPFIDGQSAVIGGREHVLTDIVVPSPKALVGWPEPMADYSRLVFSEAMRAGARISPRSETTDRWGRIAGALGWRTPSGRETTLQEILVGQGAARVAPQSEDLLLLNRLFALEDRARGSALGLWSHKAYRVRDATNDEMTFGFQLYQGAITEAAEYGGRVFFNFGADYKTDFTATVRGSAFRRWKTLIDLASCAGQTVEVRGLVEPINGPSIELKHELQMRFIMPPLIDMQALP